jgi:hypothetical protein
MRRLRRLMQRGWAKILIGSLKRYLATECCTHETVNLHCRICVLLAMAGGVVPG